MPDIDLVQRILSDRHLTYGFSIESGESGIRELEDRGVGSFWSGGHIASPNPSPEAMVAVARLTGQVRSAVVGSSILMLPLYPPALVAKQFAEIDRYTNGNSILGVGVGGEHPGDFRAMEVPVAERGKRTDEALALLRRFWTAEAVTVATDHHSFENVRIHPAPVRAGGPPVVIGGRKPAAMRRAALLGDGWLPYMYSAKGYRRSVEQIRAEADRCGRDLTGFGWMVWTLINVDDDSSRARHDLAVELGATTGQDFEPLVSKLAVAGNRDEVTRQLIDFVEAGARHFIFAPYSPNRQRIAHRLIDEIMPDVIETTSSVVE
jgi:alkanesulfonate monooxygenase SsuD/methylene tetrahydromethanopterin reductase-like flavin-dependent oxidoreductase (luciferase family)